MGPADTQNCCLIVQTINTLKNASSPAYGAAKHSKGPELIGIFNAPTHTDRCVGGQIVIAMQSGRIVGRHSQKPARLFLFLQMTADSGNLRQPIMLPVQFVESCRIPEDLASSVSLATIS